MGTTNRDLPFNVTIGTPARNVVNNTEIGTSMSRRLVTPTPWRLAVSCTPKQQQHLDVEPPCGENVHGRSHRDPDRECEQGDCTHQAGFLFASVRPLDAHFPNPIVPSADSCEGFVTSP